MEKSLVIDIKAYSADAKLRRNLLSVRTGIAAVGGALSERVFSIAPTVVYNHAMLSNNKATIIYSNRPITIATTVGANTITMPLSTSLVLTSPIDGLSLTNADTINSADVVIIQS